MESLTAFMNTLSFNEFANFETFTLTTNNHPNSEISRDYKYFTHSILQFNKQLDQRLQEEIVNTLHCKISFENDMTAEVEHYIRIIKLYTIFKTYLTQLSHEKLVETPELNAMLDVQPPIIANVLDLLIKIKRETNLDPANEIYTDLSPYARNLLVILDYLISYIIKKYSDSIHICTLAFNKRTKFIISTYNIIMCIFYILIYRNF